MAARFVKSNTQGGADDPLLPSSRSKREFQRQLDLEWIAHAFAQEPVEVKQAGRDQWIDIVFVVEEIEFVAFIAVGECVVFAEIEAIEIAEGEGIAFVGVVI